MCRAWWSTSVKDIWSIGTRAMLARSRRGTPFSFFDASEWNEFSCFEMFIVVSEWFSPSKPYLFGPRSLLGKMGGSSGLFCAYHVLFSLYFCLLVLLVCFLHTFVPVWPSVSCPLMYLIFCFPIKGVYIRLLVDEKCKENCDNKEGEL